MQSSISPPSIDREDAPSRRDDLTASISPTGASRDIRTLGAGAGLTMAGSVLGRALLLAIQILLARTLGPPLFGLYAIGWTMLRLVGTVSSLGLDSGVVRFGSRRGLHPGRFGNILFQSIGAAVLAGFSVGIVCFVLAPWLANEVFENPNLVPVLRIFSVAFPLYAGLVVAAAATRVTQRMKHSMLVEQILPPLLNIVLILILFSVGEPLLGAAAASVLAYALAFATALYFLYKLFPTEIRSRPRIDSFDGELFGFSLSASAAGSLVLFMFWGSRLVVAYFLPPADVALYHAAFQLAMLFAIILSAFNAVFAPMIAALHQRGENVRVNALYKVSTRWVLYLCVPFFITLTVAPETTLTIVFGADYAGAWPALLVLSLGQAVNAGTGGVGVLLVQAGNPGSWLRISSVAFVVSVLLHLLLVPRYGIVGAALATTLAVATLFSGALFLVRRTLGYWPYDLGYLKGLGLAGLTLALVWSTGDVFEATPVVGFVSRTLAATALFGMFLWLVGFSNVDRDFLRLLRTKLGRPLRADERLDYS